MSLNYDEELFLVKCPECGWGACRFVRSRIYGPLRMFFYFLPESWLNKIFPSSFRGVMMRPVVTGRCPCCGAKLRYDRTC